MSYPALPDHRIPYDIDGTAAYKYSDFNGCPAALTGAELLIAQGIVIDESVSVELTTVCAGGFRSGLAFFFPEQRECTGVFAFAYYDNVGDALSSDRIVGSNDTTNGLDGTFEVASLPSGGPITGQSRKSDSWRSGIKPVSFTGGKRTVIVTSSNNTRAQRYFCCHLYGEKVAGQTPDDVLFVDPDSANAEFPTALDFGDRPLATSVIDNFAIKNASPTKTANGINIQCNDADFALSSDGGATWVVTINITSLAAGAVSSTFKVRNTTPAVGSKLGPRTARITAIVTSWT